MLRFIGLYLLGVVVGIFMGHPIPIAGKLLIGALAGVGIAALTMDLECR